MIAWVDVETTGLDERAGELLEVALVITDDELDAVAVMEHVVAHDVTLAWGRADAVVQTMHGDSGLWRDIVVRGVPIDLVEKLLLRGVLDVVKRWEMSGVEFNPKATPLAGSTVGFDRRWLRHHLPRFEALWSHRSIDVSSVNELARRWAPELHAARPGAGGPVAHRALPDVRASLDVLRHYKRAGLFGGAR